jgi:streptogramin lyase
MRTRGILTVAIAISALASGATGARHVIAQGAAALSGVVSSQEEGKMEGVVVNARRDGANFTVSVVSDAQGAYSFPRTHLTPGTYALTIRAAGYDLSAPATAEVATSVATLDLNLQKTKDLASQLSSLEWTMSMPGPVEQKDKLVYQAASCAYCHTYERIVKSKHTAEEWVPVITRMLKYYPDGTASSNDGRGRGQMQSEAGLARAEANPSWGIIPGVPKAELGKYLATVNLSGGKTTWPYELKTLPRPKGKATRVIMTQWDQPRKSTVTHDMDMDADGTFWYTDESRMFIGKLEPKTNTFTEYPLPPVPAGDIPGARDIQVDQEGNLWFPMRVAGSRTVLTKFDPKTEQLTSVQGAGGQFMSLGPDGKIWAGFTRVDPKTMKVERSFPWNKSPNLPPGPHGGYADLVTVDSKGNPYATDFVGSYIFGVDANSGEARFWPTPTRDSMPRRGLMDSQDRLWFAEYTGDKIGMFDTRTEKMQEWPVPHKYTTPYTVSRPDGKGRVYSSSNMSERLMRLDPQTGEIVEYQIPTNFDAKKIAIDPTNPNAIFMANTRSARILRVEPLD